MMKMSGSFVMTVIISGCVGAAVALLTRQYVDGTHNPKLPNGQNAAIARQNPNEDENDEDEDDHQDLANFNSSWEECKLVLVVRTDLGMTKGKIAAQAGHATLMCYKTLQLSPAGRSILARWERFGQSKVAVQVKSEEELEMLQAQAMSLRICARIVHDAGRTQIATGSATVLGIGPAPKSVVDQVTGGLKLL